MASSLNKVMLIGNLTRDPELRKTASGQSVASFTIATNRVYTATDGQKKDQADYHSCVAWGRLAEVCAQYLFKGKKVYVDGRLQTREWEAQDGQKRYRTEVVIDNMIMLDRPSQGGTARPAESSEQVSGMLADEPSQTPAEEIKLEDIPF